MRSLSNIRNTNAWILLLASAVSMSGMAEVSPIVDMAPPEIKNAVVPSQVPLGESIWLEVEVEDNAGVAEVIVRYRSPGTAEFASVPMIRVGNGRYRLVLPPAVVVGPKLEYFFEARDLGGNTVMRGNASMPLQMTVLMPDPVLTDAMDGTTTTTLMPDPLLTDAMDGTPTTTRHKPSYWKWVLGTVAVGTLAAWAKKDGDDEEDLGGDSPPPPTVITTITGVPYPPP